MIAAMSGKDRSEERALRLVVCRRRWAWTSFSARSGGAGRARKVGDRGRDVRAGRGDLGHRQAPSGFVGANSYLAQADARGLGVPGCRPSRQTGHVSCRWRSRRRCAPRHSSLSWRAARACASPAASMRIWLRRRSRRWRADDAAAGGYENLAGAGAHRHAPRHGRTGAANPRDGEARSAFGACVCFSRAQRRSDQGDLA